MAASRRDQSLVDTARNLILDNLNDHPSWEQIREQMNRLYPESYSLGPVLTASLRLERAGVVVRGFDGRFYRPGELGGEEPIATDPGIVAMRVAALDWSGSRTAWPTFIELSRWRHCDVYDAMYALHAQGLITARGQRWFWIADRPTRATTARARRKASEVAVKGREAGVAVLAEQILVDAYVKYIKRTIGRRLELERKCGMRRADVYDQKRELLIEAKADVDAIVVAHAVGQVNLYRHLAPRGVRRVAVLLPAEPSKDVRSFLVAMVVGLIWREGNEFIEALA